MFNNATSSSNGNNQGNNGSLTNDNEQAFGDLSIYDDANKGHFDGDLKEIKITCESGTSGAYEISNNKITFKNLKADSIYSISGKLKGNIVIDVGDNYKFDLELKGFSLISDSKCPIQIISGNEVSITAKKDKDNYIYDEREHLLDNDINILSAIYSEVDLEVKGKGNLYVTSNNNSGIHTKKDLQIKNLNLFVSSLDNAVKGNDSVEIVDATTTLISTSGDAVKTSNSDISSKGNQRGTISISGGEHAIYAANDGIDAAYDVVIDNEATKVNIYTDKYSNFSGEVIDVQDDCYYIRYTSKKYNYSLKYYNSDTDYKFVDATYETNASDGDNTYYYYSANKLNGYNKVQVYVYETTMKQGQDDDYVNASENLTISTAYDTIAVSNHIDEYFYGWTNYSVVTKEGSTDDGNIEKGNHSSKGIKADNEIKINNGNLTIKSYDDAIHAANDAELENGKAPLGNVNINNGNLNLYSNGDSLHADNKLVINNGRVNVINSYEGIEANTIDINAGDLSIISKDDGINANATSGTPMNFNGGQVYIYCNGDALDSSSSTNNAGINFNGSDIVLITSSNGHSAIDTIDGYKYSKGRVVAIMPNSKKSDESIKCGNFESIAICEEKKLNKDEYLEVLNNNDTEAIIKVPTSINATVIYLGSSTASYNVHSSTPNAILDNNGVYFG